MMKYSLDELARMIDHTNLKPYVKDSDLEVLCKEALDNHFKMVAINQVQTKLCADILKDSDIGIGAAVSFPLGQTTIEVKKYETLDAIENGATEIDYVINLTELKNQNYDYLTKEMTEIVEICKENNVISKVIFETFYLEQEEIKKMAEIAKVVKPDFIKTSTGFSEGGATLEDVTLMKEVVGHLVKVKASGGIRNANDFVNMIKYGAERIGTSAGISILNEFSEQMKESGVDYIEI